MEKWAHEKIEPTDKLTLLSGSIASGESRTRLGWLPSALQHSILLILNPALPSGPQDSPEQPPEASKRRSGRGREAARRRRPIVQHKPRHRIAELRAQPRALLLQRALRHATVRERVRRLARALERARRAHLHMESQPLTRRVAARALERAHRAHQPRPPPHWAAASNTQGMQPCRHVGLQPTCSSDSWLASPARSSADARARSSRASFSTAWRASSACSLSCCSAMPPCCASTCSAWVGLQPAVHGAAAWTAWGCSLQCMGLQPGLHGVAASPFRGGALRSVSGRGFGTRAA